MDKLNIKEIAEKLGVKVERLYNIRRRYGIDGPVEFKKGEGAKKPLFVYNEEQQKQFKRYSDRIVRKEKEGKKDNRDNVKVIEFIEIGGKSKIYQVFEVVGDFTKSLGTITEDKLDIIKEQLVSKGIKIA